MIFIDLIGYLAGIMMAIALFPQVFKSWKSKSTKDISLLWTILLGCALTLWIIYAYLLGTYPLLIFASVELLMTLSMLLLKLKYK